jgi:hypothetical protein
VERLKQNQVDKEAVQELFRSLDEARSQLAAANALLAQARGYHEGLDALIDSHLSGQAPTRTDHERAVLEATAAIDHRDLKRWGRDTFNGLHALGRAELARRGAK